MSLFNWMKRVRDNTMDPQLANWGSVLYRHKIAIKYRMFKRNLNWQPIGNQKFVLIYSEIRFRLQLL